MKRITETYAWGNGDGLTMLDEDDHDGIRQLLLGHKIDIVFDDHMLLDNGVLVKVYANEGCGGCSSGWYSLSTLNRVDNVITNVEFVERDAPDDDDDADFIYEVFVVAADERINLYAIEGSDGNGYYGTGYRLLIQVPETVER